MVHVCSIIPPHVHKFVCDHSQLDQSIKELHRATLTRTHALRSARFNVIQQLAAQGAHVTAQSVQGIVPPHVHQQLAQAGSSDDQKDVSARTLQQDTELRAARAGATAAPHPNRTIYDAEHTEDYNNLPGDVVLIKEGGQLVPKAKDPSEDPNEAYQHFGDTWQFYYDEFKRNSINGKGLKLIGSVHFGVKYQNAFWDGRQMVFGDGDGVVFTQFTAFPDVVGHELTHGVVQYECNLNYSGQSGALNESLADVFGIQIKQRLNNETDPNTADWVIAKGIWGPGINGRGLRDMKAPGTAYDDPTVGKDPQPATMANYQALPNDDSNDNGGVHINSGIPNHAFYLAAVKIGKASWQGAGPIWYKTLIDDRLSSNATFQDFATLTIANAGEYAAQVTEAWKEVGITASKDKSDL